ncbi:hypothetical protein [Tuwongella immobilis]|uniref:Uncharacterized protein n=1 Tax=Tuwongella immobilis TaxID=692036 RepID=A0A6C2YLP9_9BACT|nr:hypothetical protein [Tuwongella immobilis]VIP01842.1 unnamed protein product [Tuwongella immobilis]VTR99614.1 unnamed protein product [Tuwongella immobilis]
MMMLKKMGSDIGSLSERWCLMYRVEAIFRFIEALGRGDPIAWGLVGIFAIIGAGLGLFTWKISRDLKREDEERKNRYRRKPRPKSD